MRLTQVYGAGMNIIYNLKKQKDESRFCQELVWFASQVFFFFFGTDSLSCNLSLNWYQAWNKTEPTSPELAHKVLIWRHRMSKMASVILHATLLLIYVHHYMQYEHFIVSLNEHNTSGVCAAFVRVKILWGCVGDKQKLDSDLWSGVKAVKVNSDNTFINMIWMVWSSYKTPNANMVLFLRIFY